MAELQTAGQIEARIWMRLAGRNVLITDLTPISPTRQFIRSLIVEEIAGLHRGLAEANERWYMGSPMATIDDIRRRVADYGGPQNPGPTAAYGTALQVTVITAYDLPANTQVATQPTDGSAPVQFAVMANGNPDSLQGDRGDGSWHLTANVQRTIPIQATVAGAGGNISANVISATGVTGLPSNSTVSNLAVSNGTDALDAPAYWNLFKSWLLSLRGSSVGAILYNLQFNADGSYRTYSNGRRVHAATLQVWDGRTLLTAPAGSYGSAQAGGPANLVIYIDEGAGASVSGAAMADDQLLQDIAAYLYPSPAMLGPQNQGIIDAGLPFGVAPALAHLVPVVATLDIDSTSNPATVLRQAEAAINVYFAGIGVGGTTALGGLQGTVNYALLFKAVVSVPGVLAVSFGFPTANVYVPTGYKAVPSPITLTGQVITK